MDLLWKLPALYKKHWPVASYEKESCLVMPDSSWPQGLYSLQDRILEWVAFPFRVSSQPRDWTQVSHIVDRFFTSWATREAQEYWSGWLISSPGDLPDPRIKPVSSALQAVSLSTELWGKLTSSYTFMTSFLNVTYVCILFDSHLTQLFWLTIAAEEMEAGFKQKVDSKPFCSQWNRTSREEVNGLERWSALHGWIEMNIQRRNLEGICTWDSGGP